MPAGIFDASKVSFVYSGGGSNIFPEKSLGGSPSAFPIQLGLNNLFDDSFSSGILRQNDYCCFYVFNDNDSTYRDAVIWVESQTDGGADIQLGLRTAVEKQKIIIEAIAVTGGSLTMDVGGCEFTFSYSSDITVWASNLKSALITSCSLTNADVVGSTFDSGPTELFIFEITFDTTNSAYDLIEFVSSTLTGSGILTPAIQRIVAGGPINEIAAAIGNKNTIPAGVSFGLTNRSMPTSVGTLKSNEGFPVWVKRTIPTDAVKTTPDGFIFKIGGIGVINI